MKSRYAQIFQLLRPYRFSIALAVLLSLLPAYFQVWLPFLLGKSIDLGLVAKDLRMFFLMSGLFTAVYLLMFVIESLTNFFLIRFGLKILVEYRTWLLSRILSYRMDFFDRISAGKLSTRLTNDINSLQELFSSALIVLIGNSILILGVALAMLLLNWRLALVAFLVMPGLYFLIRYFHIRMRRRTGFMRKSLSGLNSYIGESFSGLSDIRGLGARNYNRRRFVRLSQKYADKHRAAAREYAIFNPSSFFLTSIMNILVLMYGAWAYSNSWMSLGEILAFLTYVNFFAWPIQEFTEKFSVLQEALAAVDRLMEVSQHEPEENRGQLDFQDFQTIEFRQVSFRYRQTENWAVQDLSFKANKGEKIAFIGESGGGKTTTCSLLMRFYDVSSGSILIDENPIQSFELSSLRKNIGWVAQDVSLFSGSLRENLRFFDPDISDDRIWRLLEIIQLKDWVQSLPGGLDEPLTERASSISSGQRQLISLARALLPQPKIFIFDEATSHVDSHTEYMLQQALENLWQSSEFKDMTGFIIAHRLSTIQRCDRIYVFRNGKILEDGTFQELMNLKGCAHLLQQKQYGEVLTG